MDRREFLEQVTSIAAFIPGLTLLPETDTVGATSVGVNRFIDLLLSESMLAAQRDRFLAGLAAIDARSQSLFGTAFITAHREQQESLMRALDVPWPEPSRTSPEAGRRRS